MFICNGLSKVTNLHLFDKLHCIYRKANVFDYYNFNHAHGIFESQNTI
jgi:hypothetical protein